MQFLFLSSWYHPEPVAKPHQLARELVRRGHEVSVVTAFPSYPSGRIYEGYRRGFARREDIDGVRVVRLPTLIDRSRSGVRRVLSMASYAAGAATAGVLGRRPDVIWTYQIGLPGVAQRYRWGSAWVHEVQDLWPEWGRASEVSMRGPLYRILDRQERFLYARADHITTISAGFKRTLVGKGVPDGKITVFPNWADDAVFTRAPRDEELGRREGLAGRFNVMYVGNIGPSQALDVLLDTAARLMALPDAQLVVVGDGLDRSRLEREAQQRGLANLRFLGPRDPREVAGYFAWSDVLLVHLRDDPVYSITIPSKTYAYLGAGKPILVAARGDVAAMIQAIDAGPVCEPENPVQLAATIRRLAEGSPDRLVEMGENARNAFTTRFSRTAVVDAYEQFFGELAELRTYARRA